VSRDIELLTVTNFFDFKCIILVNIIAWCMHHLVLRLKKSYN